MRWPALERHVAGSPLAGRRDCVDLLGDGTVVTGSPRLPSWRPGRTRDQLLAFLDAADEIDPEERVACFDNDGTLWCERPTYVQFEFFVAELGHRAAADRTIEQRPEFSALLSGDARRVADLGPERVVAALGELHSGITPEVYRGAVRDFVERARHRLLGCPVTATRYQPMLELLAELRRRQFTVAIVTGGGVEFVRAVSERLYGVAPELVVGTAVGYSIDRTGGFELRRTSSLSGAANEGAAKVASIQAHLGRRPVFAAGNSAGDREMLEWADGQAGGFALLVDHDDAAREFAYVSRGETVTEDAPITAVAARHGWGIASMRDDWSTIFCG